jgi:hypothetical protein
MAGFGGFVTVWGAVNAMAAVERLVGQSMFLAKGAIKGKAARAAKFYFLR